MKYDPRVYGYVNGRPVYTRDDFIFAVLGFGPIEADAELLAYAEKVTSGWSNAGWHQKFEDYYLSDYALSEPYRSLTAAEFNRLRELQAASKEREKQADAARKWHLVDTIYWADNSIKQRILAWELQGHYFTDNYPGIGTALVLVFSTAPVLRPIRPHRWPEYEKIWK